METAKIVYESEKLTRATHIRSGNTLITDAPVDNNGKGSAFSPTDLLSTSLACCMMTIMAIKAEKNNFELGRLEAQMTKTMGTDPRRVTIIEVVITFSRHFDPEVKKMLEDAALHCPVAMSLHPDIRQNIRFVYPQ